MSVKPLFAGLVFDEYDNVVETTNVGQESCYVVDDAGFKRHIPSQEIDRQVLAHMQDMMKGHEDIISEQAAKMLGQEDIFSRAMLKEQLKNIDQQFEQVLEAGLSEDNRAYMGMMGFKIIVNLHGEVLEIKQPGIVEPE
ncbi:MAG: hypothetical protein DRI56_02345 [Chloroflexota bacterium]|nr:MAG: hypothetical protein DRI56_02345 [Chloroflexota bacterium]